MEVLKVRLQAQNRSTCQTGQPAKYSNAAQAAFVIAKEEGPRALFSGMSLTALRQATNVSGKVIHRSISTSLTNLIRTPSPVNLSVYTKLKQILHNNQPMYQDRDLPGFQTALCGLVAGAAGPMSNAPIDTLSRPPSRTDIILIPQSPLINRIETLVQRSPTPPGESSISHTVAITGRLFQQEGLRALYKGITPRIMRIAPGQAITYSIYEFLKGELSA